MHRLVDDYSGGEGGETPTRLAPEIANFRRLLLRFVRDYIVHHGSSPSYAEIAAKLGTNKERVKRAIRSLEREQLLIRKPGQRGLFLPELRDACLDYLRALGYAVDDDVLAVALPVTKRTLLTAPVLDYAAPGEAPAWGMDGDSDGEPGSEGAGADARDAA